ncbi:MAG: helix-turn-helix transcriptional regulator [Anaerolineaceae bacterium]|nr:helix-turn-helix transcriptional regulator [Anaerolineaceae bacterium]
MSFIDDNYKNSGTSNQNSSGKEQCPEKISGFNPVHSGLPDPCNPDIASSEEGLTPPSSQTRNPNVDYPKLSLREAEVLQCLANGLSPEQTALELTIKTRTVRKYLSNLRNKFNTDSRDQLMARAGYLGLCDPYRGK